MKPIHQLIKDTILLAIEAKTPCMITIKSQGIFVLSYRGATEIPSILRLSHNEADINGNLYIDWYHVPYIPAEKPDPGPIEQGAIIIDWEKIGFAKISESGRRMMITLSDFEINFLQEIVK